MSVSIAILKVLSSYPEGRAGYASLKSDLAILSTSEWLARMRTLARRAGPINLFSEMLVTRDAHGWTLTPAGRHFLDRLENGDDLRRPDPAWPGLRVITSDDPVAIPNPKRAAHLRLVQSA